MSNRTSRIILVALLLPGLLALSAWAISDAPYKVGATVSSDIKLKDIYGKEHTFGDFRGKVVLVHFWSIRCPTLKVAEPKFKALQKEFGDKAVVQIAINANQRELKGDYADLREHVKKAGVNFMVTVDPGNKITDIFGGKSTPHCFVIDKEGTLRYSGALDDDPRGRKAASEIKPYVHDAITALLDGKPVEVATTKPYG